MPESPVEPGATDEAASAPVDAAAPAADEGTTAAPASSGGETALAVPPAPLPPPSSVAAPPPGYATGATAATPTPTGDWHAGWVEPPLPPPAAPAGPPPFEGRAYPARYARRPLTLGEGVLRIDSGSAGRLGGPGGFGIQVTGVAGLRLGVTSDLEIGLSLPFASRSPIVRDPTLDATFRFFHDDVAEVGVRASVRVPVITTGDTVLRFGVPVVLHGGNWLRVMAALDLDLLFTANVSALVSVPIQVAFSTGDGFSIGAEGWIGVLDGRDPVGAVGAFGQITGRTPVRAIGDFRFAVTYLVAERAGMISTAMSFFPQLW